MTEGRLSLDRDGKFDLYCGLARPNVVLPALAQLEERQTVIGYGII